MFSKFLEDPDWWQRLPSEESFCTAEGDVQSSWFASGSNGARPGIRKSFSTCRRDTVEATKYRGKFRSASNVRLESLLLKHFQKLDQISLLFFSQSQRT